MPGVCLICAGCLALLYEHHNSSNRPSGSRFAWGFSSLRLQRELGLRSLRFGRCDSNCACDSYADSTYIVGLVKQIFAALSLEIFVLLLTGLVSLSADSSRFLTSTNGPPPLPALVGPFMPMTISNFDVEAGPIGAALRFRAMTEWIAGSTRKVSDVPVDILGTVNQISVYEQHGRVSTGHVARVVYQGQAYEMPVGAWGPSSNVVRRFFLQGTNQIILTNAP